MISLQIRECIDFNGMRVDPDHPDWTTIIRLYENWQRARAEAPKPAKSTIASVDRVRFGKAVEEIRITFSQCLQECPRCGNDLELWHRHSGDLRVACVRCNHLLLEITAKERTSVDGGESSSP